MRATAALVSSSRARAAVLVGHGNTSHGRCAARRVELQRPIAAVHAMTPADYYAGQPLYRMSNGKVVVANAALASGSGGGISGGSGGGAGGQHGASTVARAKSAGALATPQPDVVPVQFVVPHFATRCASRRGGPCLHIPLYCVASISAAHPFWYPCPQLAPHLPDPASGRCSRWWGPWRSSEAGRQKG